MADRKGGRTAADQSDAHAAETIRLLSRGPSNGRGGGNDHDEDEFDDDVDSNLDSADENADGDSYLDDSGGDNASSSRHSSERGPLARGGAGVGTTRAQQNEHLRRRRRRTAGLLCVITVVLLFALAIAAGIDRRHKNGDNDDDGGVGPRVNLGYAQYAGTRLPKVYPPSSDGGSDHDTRANPIAVNKFLGMRYAAPPVGARRWQAPAPPDNETAVQAATDFRPICLGMGADPAPGSGQAEDCLFVNVWAPASAMAKDGAHAADETANSKGVPVWVFIQGGGYVANSNPNIDGADVVARSGGHVVFVNFSYRVGLYGFLAAPGTAATDADVVPNAGLLDQRALLAWVQEHIHRFGGDPQHVVVHGGSAGAGSVALHTVAYGGHDDGLFVGAVAQSVFVPTLPTCADVTYKFWRAVHAVCPDLEDGDDDNNNKAVGDAVACLRKTPVELLQQRANVPSSFQFRGNASTEGPGVAGFYWGPCVDGDLIVDRPSVLFRQGRYVHVPMLYGVASDEGTILVANAASQDDVVGFIVSNYPGLGPAGEAGTAASVIAQHYPQAPAVPQHAPWFPTLAHVYGEVTFVCPAVNTLDAVAAVPAEKSAAPRPALFAYRYAMQDPGLMAAGLGTVHMMDAAAVFGPRNVICCPPASYFRPDDGSTSPEEDRNGNPGLVPVMMDYFISFVRSLDPNTHKSPHAADWVPWGRPEERTDADRRQRLVVYTGGHQAMETVPDDQSARCRVWLDLADRLEQ